MCRHENGLTGGERLLEDGDMSKHWDDIYRKNDLRELGWYEDRPVSSLALVSRAGLQPGSAIADVGSGASFFVDDLVDAGYRNVYALDISAVALTILSTRLGRKSEYVKFVNANACSAGSLPAGLLVDMWHDRACYHFLTEDADRRRYRLNMLDHLRRGGYAIFSEFSPSSPPSCSGLDVRRYSTSQMRDEFGEEFGQVEGIEAICGTGTGRRFYSSVLLRRR